MKTVDRVYEFVVEFMKEHQYAPSTREICVGVGLKSTSSVNGYLETLKRRGMIDFIETCPRTISVAGYRLRKIEHDVETVD